MLDVYHLASGILIGLSLAVPPGPVNAVIAAESVKDSYVNGIKVGLGALTADATFLVIALIGVAIFFNNETVKTVVSLIGGVILAYMALGILKDFRKPIQESGKKDIKNYYLTGVAIGFTNPAAILWWITAGAVLIASTDIAGIAGFFIGVILWVTSFSVTLHYAKSKAQWIYPAVIIISGVALLFFGAVLIYNGLQAIF
ncbi:MAG TPA: LysE family transporter [Methanocella sp.]|uniref:LysE family transporter n=1 Tax=Methanocella sp. TaxID=2052833 RepID=UPI002C920AE0|nr:LysE family transporter [Methanocella sp.]HTY90338.1 LysE family transporter [Methanocella sp.]